MTEQMKHGSETFFIEGEGLLTTQVGGRSGDGGRPGLGVGEPEGAGDRAIWPGRLPPPFRFSARRARRATPLNATITRKLARAMIVGRRWRREDPRRLHLPRPVRRPRPDHGPHRRDARRGRRPRRTCSRAARRGSTSTRCTAPGPATPSPRSSTRPTACTSRPVRRSAAEGVKAKPRHDLPRVGTGRSGRRAEGADPRPAQRREPDRRPDPPRDDQLPQQGRRQDARPALPTAAAVHPGPQAGDAALPVDAAPRLPAADLRARGGQRRVHERPQAGRARCAADRRADDADRVLGGRVPARAQHDPQRLQLELATSPAPPGPWTGCSSSPRSVATCSASGGCSAAGSPTGGGCTTSRPAASPGLAAPDSGVNMAMRIDTRLTDPLAVAPAEHLRRRRERAAAAPQPGLPQPDPRQHGQARQRPADGHQARRAWASTSRR